MDEIKETDRIIARLVEELGQTKARIKELETDLKLNASMLAKQTDLAREAETSVKETERLYELELGRANKAENQHFQANLRIVKLEEGIQEIINSEYMNSLIIKNKLKKLVRNNPT